MKILKEIGKILKSPDLVARDTIFEVLEALVDSDTFEECQRLASTPFMFVCNLGGENGSARLLQSNNGDEVVMKTYEPTANPVTGEIIDNKNRLELLQHEVAVFLVAQVIPLTKVPVTILRAPSKDEIKAWGMFDPKIFAPSFPLEQSVMVQQYISDKIPFNISADSLIDKIGVPGIFNQVIFDYLIAYDDGRFANFLVTSDDIFSIDHGNCFLFRGAIRLESMGIYGNLELDDTSELLETLSFPTVEQLILGLESILGKKKARAFANRLELIKKLLIENSSIDLYTLEHYISMANYPNAFPQKRQHS